MDSLEVRLNPSGDGVLWASISLLVDGTVRWTAEPPNGARNDSWVAGVVAEGAVIAHTFSGFEIQLSLDTGRVEKSSFTK